MICTPERRAFEAWLAKGTPGHTVEDLYHAFQAGGLFAEVSEAHSYEYALAILQGERPAGAEVAADTGRGGGPGSPSADGHGKPGASTPGKPPASRDPLAASAPVAEAIPAPLPFRGRG